MITHPIQTVESVAKLYLALLPGPLNDILINEISKIIEEEYNKFIEGNGNVKARMIGRAVGEILLIVIGEYGTGIAIDVIRASAKSGELSKIIDLLRVGEKVDNVVVVDRIAEALRIIDNAGVSDELLIKWGVSSDKDIIKFAEFINAGLDPNSNMYFYEWFNRSTFKFNELSNLGIDTYEDLNKALFDFERMNDDFLEHVFGGQLNNSNKLTGYHYENFPNAIAKVKNIIKVPNSFGVYEAEVETIGGGIIKEGTSTFFPKEWTPKQVMDAVMEAYWNGTSLPNGWWEGVTKDGMIITMRIENSGPAGMPRIVTAFPVY